MSAGGKRPNIVLVLTDQQQGAMMGCAGHSGIHTPSMDRLALEGARFSNAFCTTPQCSPSRASILTGMFPHRHSVLGNIPDTDFGPEQLPAGIPQLGTLLEKAGYQTAYFGKWHLGKSHDRPSNPTSYGFHHFSPTRLMDERESEDDLAEEAAAYIEGHSGPNPFAVVTSFNDPHGVYQLPNVPEQFTSREFNLPTSIKDNLSEKPSAQREYRDSDQPASLPLNEETAHRYLSWYATMVERADSYLGQLLTALDNRPDLCRNTIVIFASDHGDLAFAHGLPFKGPCMYEELIKVPLLVRGPGVVQGIVREELVSLHDLLPTILQWANIDVPTGIDGVSLLDLLTTRKSVRWRDAVIGQYHGKQRWAIPIRMIRTERYKFNLYAGGDSELYDLSNDRDELQNLSNVPNYREIRDDLRARLEDWIVAEGDPFHSLSPSDMEGRPLFV